MDSLILTVDQSDHTFFIIDLKKDIVSYKAPKEEKLSDIRAQNKGRNIFRPFGIAQNNEKLFIASHGKVVSFKKDFSFNEEIISNYYPNTHQILFDNNWLYLTGTSVNCISKHNLKTQEKLFFCTEKLKIINPPSLPPDVYQHDTRHPNSLLINNFSLWFVNHNRGKPSQIIELDKNNFNIKNIYENMGIDVHNLVLKNNAIYFLSTAEYTLKKLDLITRTVSVLHCFNNSIFLRGLCMINDTLFIGGSFTTVKDYSLQTPCIFKYDFKNTTITQLFLSFRGAILDMQVLRAKKRSSFISSLGGWGVVMDDYWDSGNERKI